MELKGKYFMKLAILVNVIAIYLILKKLSINKKLKNCILKFGISNIDKTRFILFLCANILILLNFLANINLNSNLYNISVIRNPYTYFSVFIIELCILTILMIKNKIGVTQDGIIYFFKIYKWVNMERYRITQNDEIQIILKHKIFKNKIITSYNFAFLMFKSKNKEKDAILSLLRTNNVFSTDSNLLTCTAALT